jgi:energy-converting hydrogenase Eha subunit H
MTALELQAAGRRAQARKVELRNRKIEQSLIVICSAGAMAISLLFTYCVTHNLLP